MEILEHPYLRLPRPVFNAWVVARGLMTGVFSPAEAALLLKRKFKNKDTQSKLFSLQRRGMAKFVNRDGSLTLYGHALYSVTEDPEDILYLIDQIIKCNQYHTELIKQSDVVIDAGANQGIFSIKVAHENPHAKIYAFEPVRETFLCLKKNTAAYPNIFCYELGLGDVAASKSMMIRKNGSDANRMTDSAFDSMEEAPADELRQVPVVSIDEFVAEHNIPRVDFIKMDTEGYEGKILTGASKTIHAYKPTIAMSAYHGKSDRELLPKLLTGIVSGYDMKLEKRSELDFICTYPHGTV